MSEMSPPWFQNFIYATSDEDKLKAHVLQGIWDEVVEMYTANYASVHTVTINDSQDTALHAAVDNGEESIVAKLVNLIVCHEESEKELEEEEDQGIVPGKDEKKSALEIENARGDTPLHLAASRGFANMCYCIVGEKNERANLLKVRNKRGETPLFLAALNWKKNAFFYLHRDFCHTIVDLHRDVDQDTILHRAIRREYFDLAVIIILEHRELAGFVNKEGETPLKLLAARPLAFRSGSNLRWWEKLLYHCLHVEQVDVETYKNLPPESALKIDHLNPQLKSPENYDTCFQFIATLPKIASLFGFFTNNKQQEENKNSANDESCYNFFMKLPKIGASLIGFIRKKQQSAGDTENPERKQKKEDNVDKKLGNLPPNYATFSHCLSTASVLASVLLGLDLLRIKRMKEKHVWSAQLLGLLMEDPIGAYFGSGNRPPRVDESIQDILNNYRPKHDTNDQGQKDNKDNKDNSQDKEKKDKDKVEDEIDMKDPTFLIAAKNGILEIVDQILYHIPIVIQETTLKHKRNILLVAVESRQPFVVKTLSLMEKQKLWENLILAEDTEENTVLHLAAGQSSYRAWQIPGSAMQMLWDIKWYEYVKSLVPHHFHFRHNKGGQTPPEIFKEKHEKMVEDGSTWLKETSESCSVVAALIAGVAFATSSTVPGGNNEETGKPNYEGQPAFNVFAITSLVALCFSVTALIMFLAILTSRKTAKDFRKDLPFKLLLGLSSLFISIASMLVSFCAAHFFVVKDKFKDILFPIYAATCLPVSFYAIAQFPLYVDLLRAIFTKVPLPSDKGSDL